MPPRRPMWYPRQRQPVQTFEGVWTWIYRGVQVAMFVGGIVWFAFQFYYDVGVLKGDVNGLKVSTMELFAGQKATHDKLDKIIANQPPKAP